MGDLLTFSPELALNKQSQSPVEQASRAFLHSLIQSPLNGVVQIGDKVLGTDVLPSIQFIEPPSEAKFGSVDWHIQQFGQAAGMIPWFIGLHKVSAVLLNKVMASEGKALAVGATGKAEAFLSRKTAIDVTNSAFTGLAYGALLTPSAPEENILSARAGSAASSALTFTTLALSMRALSSRGLNSQWLAGGLSGIPAGFVGAESHSVFSGKGMASGEDVYKSIYGFSIIGLGFGLAQGRAEARHKQSGNSTASDAVGAPRRGPNGNALETATPVQRVLPGRPQSLTPGDFTTGSGNGAGRTVAEIVSPNTISVGASGPKPFEASRPPLQTESRVPLPEGKPLLTVPVGDVPGPQGLGPRIAEAPKPLIEIRQEVKAGPEIEAARKAETGKTEVKEDTASSKDGAEAGLKNDQVFQGTDASGQSGRYDPATDFLKFLETEVAGQREASPEQSAARDVHETVKEVMERPGFPRNGWGYETLRQICDQLSSLGYAEESASGMNRGSAYSKASRHLEKLLDKIPQSDTAVRPTDTPLADKLSARLNELGRGDKEEMRGVKDAIEVVKEAESDPLFDRSAGSYRLLAERVEAEARQRGQSDFSEPISQGSGLWQTAQAIEQFAKTEAAARPSRSAPGDGSGRNAGAPERQQPAQETRPVAPDAVALEASLTQKISTGEHVAAIEECTAAIENKTAQLGADHLDVADMCVVAARMYESLPATDYQVAGKRVESVAFHQRALATYEKTYGAEHPRTLQALHDTCQAALSTRTKGEAPLFERVIEQTIRQHGRDSGNTADAMLRFADYLKATTYDGRAEQYYRDGLAIRDKVYGRDHIATAESAWNLGSYLNYVGKYNEAEPYLQRALKAREGMPAEVANHTVPEVLHELAKSFLETGRYQEAEGYLRRSLDLTERNFPADNTRQINQLVDMGIVAINRGKPEAAKLLFEESNARGNQRYDKRGAFRPTRVSDLLARFDQEKPVSFELTAGNNPYREMWEALENKVNRYQAFRVRDALVRRFCWPVITERALGTIKRHGPIVDVGCGTGYIDALLQMRGADVVAYDVNPIETGKNVQAGYSAPGKSWTAVRQGGETSAGAHPDRALMLSWPPMGEPMGYNALKAYRGNTLIYIGDAEGGLTADTKFFGELGRNWRLVETAPVDQWRDSESRDKVWVYKRK